MKLKPHPAVQILVWVLFALLAQQLQPLPLLALCTVLFGVAMRLCARQLLSLLRRTRWVLFALLLVYGYATPGSALLPTIGIASPTWEGVLDGLLQLGRLLSVLSGLAILLELLPQTRLISGLYTLLYPLRWLGLSRERIAVRLALTLEYAETAMRDTAGHWKAAINSALRQPATEVSHIELRLQAFSIVDVLVLVGAGAIVMGMWR